MGQAKVRLIPQIADIIDFKKDLKPYGRFKTQLMREMKENYYLILFILASQLYFYVLGPSSLLGF